MKLHRIDEYEHNTLRTTMYKTTNSSQRMLTKYQTNAECHPREYTTNLMKTQCLSFNSNVSLDRKV